ncbi:MAG: SH3 domain-containing protein [Actinobacteria bacterium]|nr:SH3 domain-containing protein [Actinomycetota bacterium]
MKHKYWNRTTIKYSIAWFLLFFVVLIVWKMSQPVLDSTEIGNNEASATARSITGAVNSKATTITAGEVNTKQLSLPSGENRVQVTVEALNVRSAPNIRASVICSLTRGTVVTVESKEGKWMKIRTVYNKVGYISSDPSLTRKIP